MKQKSFIFSLLLLLTLAFTTTTYAHDGDQDEQNVGRHDDAIWEAYYWNNKHLSGNPIFHRHETELSHDWGLGSPDSSIPSDDFSARWTRRFDLDAGTYRVITTSDDGIRVKVNGDTIINNWNDHPVQTDSAEITVTDGHHMFEVEYYEHGGYATASLVIVPAGGPPPPNQWYGEYFNNEYLGGSPIFTSGTPNLDFNWGYGSPIHNRHDYFSARWTRTVNFNEAGTYTFKTTTDDGVRLWVDDHLLIDKWVDQAVSSHSGTIYVSGPTAIRMEYYERKGLAEAHLTWSRTYDQPPTNASTVIVDESDMGFVTGGSASSWHNANIGYGNSILWTKNNDRIRDGYNWARWYPQLHRQRYELFVYIPHNYANSQQARYWVSHRDGFTLRQINQSVYSNQWVSLGTYWFNGTNQDYVSLADITYEPYLSRYIAFDAVKWEPR